MDICKHDKIDFELKKVNDDDSAINVSNTVTCSCQLLDNVIEDATNNKKTLDSTMDDIIRLMKEVECTEKAAEQAKKEAATSSLNTLAKVEELKQARRRAKETNNTHAKEVYAQKLVLDTKVKELKLRVLGVLNQGGTSLVVLNKMHNALEKRMASALREKEFADKEKIEKECLAQKALADEENQLKKVKEMSERLKQEEVKNSKLEEFLVDRGHVVDMLDRDVSDKIKDVKLLKETFDQAVSLSEVLSSTQISSIVSARSPLTKETSKERNKPTGSDMVLDNIFSFGLNESADKNVHSATQKQSVVTQEHEENKNVTFYANKNDDIVSEKLSLTNETSKERTEPDDSDVVLEKIFNFGSIKSADQNVNSATKKQSECRKSVNFVVPVEHELLSKISNLKLQKLEGDKDVVFKADKKDDNVAGLITKEGLAVSTDGFVASGQIYAKGLAFTSTGKKGSGKRKVNKSRKR